MKPYSYDFRRITDLENISDSHMLSDIAEYSYVMLAYDGYNYKIPTKEFIDATYLELSRLNANLNYLIDNSSAQSRETESGDGNISVEEEKYIHLEYVVNSTYNSETEESDKKKFTILSYGDYSKLMTEQNSLDDNNYNTYYLSDGIATGELLNTYMSYSLDTLLGVPGTLSYITKAIDSISEFAAWFKDVQRESSYSALISYITTNDNEIIESYIAAINLLNAKLDSKVAELINSYTSADIEILNLIAETNSSIIRSYTTSDQILSNRIDNLSNTVSGLSNNKQDTLISGTNIKTINNQSLLGSGNITIEGGSGQGVQYNAGNNISISNDTINCYIGIDSANNSIKIGNTSYILEIDNTGKLSLSVDIDTYVALSLNVSGGSTTSNEYNSTITASTVNLTASVNKSCDWGNWTTSTNAGVNTYNINGLTYTAKGTYGPITKGRQQTTYTWSISASHTPQPGSDEYNHGHTSVETKSGSTSISHKFDKFKIFCFPTTETIPANITVNETNGLPDQIISNTYTKLVTSLPSNPIFSFTTNIAGRLCLILPAEWRTKPIKWTGTEGMGEVPGSSRQHIFSLYDGTKGYCTYLSASEYPIGTQINLKLE